MKRLIALDQEEFNALCGTGQYLPSYQTLSFPSGMYYVFDTEGTEEIEKLILLEAT
jgi:hypothetical protein